MMKHLLNRYKPSQVAIALFVGMIPVMTCSEAEAKSSSAYVDFAQQVGLGGGAYSPIEHYFPRPLAIEDAVHFWRQVFGEWQAHQIVLHDDEHLGIVYETIEITGYIGGRLSAEQQMKVDLRKEHLVHQLNDLNYLLHKKVGLTTEQQNLYHLILRKAGGKALKHAAERVRIQRGMKESFKMGLEASSRYNTMMREVFRQNHLPEELANLPHVESAFTTNARSPVGAVGVWQFMPTTGKRYLRIDEAIDERYDPVLSTQGAVKYLQYAFGKLGDWGLAITSYNHGLSGMVRARHEQGKDIARVIKGYDGESFGFASRNYYAEFLAVCDIMADLPRYFPESVDYQPPPAIKQVALTKPMTSGEIAKKYHIHFTKLAELNPAWTKNAAEGLVALPANSSVWLPSFVPKEERLLMTAKKTLTVSVKANLGQYRLSYNEDKPSAWSLLEVFPHGLSGQLVANAVPMPLPQPKSTVQLAKVVLPVKPVQPVKQVPLAMAIKTKFKQGKTNEIHIVQSGDSPSTIASKYSVQLRALLVLNEISAKTLIRPGQPIRIPLKINS